MIERFIEGKLLQARPSYYHLRKKSKIIIGLEYLRCSQGKHVNIMKNLFPLYLCDDKVFTVLIKEALAFMSWTSTRQLN